MYGCEQRGKNRRIRRASGVNPREEEEVHGEDKEIRGNQPGRCGMAQLGLVSSPDAEALVENRCRYQQDRKLVELPCGHQRPYRCQDKTKHRNAEKSLRHWRGRLKSSWRSHTLGA